MNYSGKDVLDKFVKIAVRRGLTDFYHTSGEPNDSHIEAAIRDIASKEQLSGRGFVLNRNHLGKCRRGEKQLTIDQVRLLADILKVPIDELTGNKPRPFVTGANRFDEHLDAAVLSRDLSDFCYLLGDESNPDACFDHLLKALKWYHGEHGFRCSSTNPKLGAQLLAVSKLAGATVSLDVVKEREDSDRAARIASVSSIESCAASRIVSFLKKRFQNRQFTGIAVGMGSTVRNVLKKVLGIIKADELEGASIQFLKIWPFVNSLDTFSPMDHTPRVFIIEDCVNAELKELARNCVQNNPHSDHLKGLRWMQDNVHAFVTSVSDWSDEHSACRSHSERNGANIRFSITEEIVGAVQSFPFTSSIAMPSVAESLCDFETLVQLAKDSPEERLSLLVATMCRECEQNRVNSLKTLLHNKRLHCFNSLVLGEKTAHEILNYPSID